MLASHEPMLDPRIDWEASYAAREYAVTVLGIQDPARTPTAPEHGKGYTIVRCIKLQGIKYSWNFYLDLLEVLPAIPKIGVSIVGALFFPILACMEILLRLWRIASTRIVTLRNATNGIRQLRWVRKLATFCWMLSKHLAPVSFVLSQEIADMQIKPRIVHCNDLDTLLVGIKAKARYGCKILYDAHEYWPFSDPNAPWYQVLFFRIYERLLIRKCDHVVTVNPLLANEFAKAYGLATVHSVPNATPWSDLRVSNSPRSLDEYARGRVKFIFLGNFAPERGIEELITAWADINHNKAALFLRGHDNEWKTKCIVLARQLGLLDKTIYFPPPVSEDALVDSASECDVGIIPYKPITLGYKFCCPNKLSQFLHAGLMVVSNNLPYVQQILRESDTGVSYDSSLRNSIATTIARVLDDEQMRARCRKNASEFARKTFNWETCYVVLQTLYAEEFRSTG